MIVTTSICANYIPKARVLAASVKRHHPEAKFVLCLVEKSATTEILNDPHFDAVLTPADLDIPNYKNFLFRYTIVEASTAVKGHLMLKLLNMHPNEEHVVYMDPDTLVISPMAELIEELRSEQIVLTPHLTEPETEMSAILDNEMAALKHGAYNLGFLGIRRGPEAVRFLTWWSERLYKLCFADYGRALFTDQKWIDLAPGMFKVSIFRHPGYNVAPWNLSKRELTRSSNDEMILSNGLPLRFFHFSGLDSGANEGMINKYAQIENPIFNLRKSYLLACDENGQKELGKTPWSYAVYDNGEPIEFSERDEFRKMPFDASDPYSIPAN